MNRPDILKRGRKRQTDVSEITTWHTRNGRYALQRSRSLLCLHLPRRIPKAPGEPGRLRTKPNPARILDVWRVLRRDGQTMLIVSTHRTRRAAERALSELVAQDALETELLTAC